MSIDPKEILIVRELAKQYMEYAVSERHVRMRKRFQDTNDLKVVRPPLMIAEIPWHEMNMDGELDCVCQDERLHVMEEFFRRKLFYERHFHCDHHMEPVWTMRRKCTSTGNGFTSSEKKLSVDPANHIVSHAYGDVLEDEASLEQYHDPVVTAYPEEDEQNKAFAESVLEGIMRVEFRSPCEYFAPWDVIARLRGVEPILIDIYERPEYLHKIIQLFVRSEEKEIEQKSALGLYDGSVPDLHCTPGDVTLPKDRSYSAGVWFRTMAQMFSTISPDAHEEFDIQYSIPLSKRFAYTYYGCCEPLHDRIDKLKGYPNLRKVGCSPWADVEKTAEILGGDYVLSRKPNPANVAIATDPEQIRREISETARLSLKYGCPCDITLKDISTVGYKPQNLIIWAQTASAVLDAFYGKE